MKPLDKCSKYTAYVKTDSLGGSIHILGCFLEGAHARACLFQVGGDRTVALDEIERASGAIKVCSNVT